MNTNDETDIAGLIHRGGVFCNITGNSIEQIYLKVSKMIDLPDYLSYEDIYNGLCSRENLLSTAVGYGFAIPHPACCLLKNEDEQRICVVYLKNPINMDAPDFKPVSTLFIVLAQNSLYHRKIVSVLAKLFKDSHFKNAINNKCNEAVLGAIIKELV